jgi:hypothetical protein
MGLRAIDRENGTRWDPRSLVRGVLVLGMEP